MVVAVPGSVEIAQLPPAETALGGRPELGGRGRDRAEEAADLSLPQRVRPHLQTDRPVRVNGGSNGKAEDTGATASGDKLRERVRRWNSVVLRWRIGIGKGELAVEKLEHVVEALGGGVHVVVFFIGGGGVDEAAVGI